VSAGGASTSGLGGPIRATAGAGLEDVAAELLQAYDEARLMPLLTPRAGGYSLAEAFAVADRVRTRRIARGERPLGYKIGFTNRTIWDRYGVHAPIWGPVWSTTVTVLDGTAHTIDLRGLVQPRLEPEVMFGFARAPRAGLSADELAGCIEWVAHGFEIVHTHFEGWRFAAADTVADYALHGRLYVGPRVPVARFERPRAELAALCVRLFCDGRQVDEGVGTNVLDGPLDALRVWVDAMHAQPERWPIAAGDIVTTGTITDAYPMAPGHVYRSELSDPRLIGLELRTREMGAAAG
jgi:2-oxo-3-hexenedioate decarboxylase